MTRKDSLLSFFWFALVYNSVIVKRILGTVSSIPTAIPLFLLFVSVCTATIMLQNPVNQEKNTILLNPTNIQGYANLITYTSRHADIEFSQYLYREVRPFLSSEERILLSKEMMEENKIRSSIQFWESLYTLQPTARIPLLALSALTYQIKDMESLLHFIKILEYIEPNNQELQILKSVQK